jgi:galactokinase
LIKDMNSSTANIRNESLAVLGTRAEQEFRSRHSRLPDFLVAAPGRVNLIGEHIDYNDGCVLPMAVERYVVIAAAPSNDDSQTATIFSGNLGDSTTVNLNGDLKPKPNGWAGYVEGVISGFNELGIEIPSFDAVIQSSIPMGGGLSSSAALEVATATLLESLTKNFLEPAQKALLCQRAEHRFAGVPCGIMDQFSSVFGKPDELMLLDCRSQEIQSIPFAADDVTVLITNSNVQHALASGEYAERRKQCGSALAKLTQSTWRDVTMDDLESGRGELSATEYCRARHVVSEIRRTTETAKAFRENDWTRIGELMYASHKSLQEDFEVSCDELDVLVALAQKIGRDGGVIGSRMTGGGFGGSTVSLVNNEKLDSVMDALTSQYESTTGITPHCFSSRPARGAHVIKG